MDFQKIAPWINLWYHPQDVEQLPKDALNRNNLVSSSWLSPSAWFPTSYKAVLVWQTFSLAIPAATYLFYGSLKNRNFITCVISSFAFSVWFFRRSSLLMNNPQDPVKAKPLLKIEQPPRATPPPKIQQSPKPEELNWKTVLEWNWSDGKRVRLLQAGDKFSLESDVNGKITKKPLELSPSETIAKITKYGASINSDGTVELWKPVHEWPPIGKNIVRLLRSGNKFAKESDVNEKITIETFELLPEEKSLSPDEVIANIAKLDPSINLDGTVEFFESILEWNLSDGKRVRLLQAGDKFSLESNVNGKITKKPLELSPNETIAKITKYGASINSEGIAELWKPVHEWNLGNENNENIVRLLRSGNKFAKESDVSGKLMIETFELLPEEKSLSPDEVIANIAKCEASINSDGTVEFWKPVHEWNLGNENIVRLLRSGDKFSIVSKVHGERTRQPFSFSENNLSPDENIAIVKKWEASINSDGSVDFFESVLEWNLSDGKRVRLLRSEDRFSIESNVGGKKTRQLFEQPYGEKPLSPDEIIAKFKKHKVSINSILSDGTVEFLPERETSIFSDSHPSKSIPISNDRWAVTIVNTIQKESSSISDSLSTNRCKEIAACVGTEAKEGCKKAVSVVVDKIQTCSDDLLISIGKEMGAFVRTKAIEGAGFVGSKIQKAAQTFAGHAVIIIEGIEDGIYKIWKAHIFGSDNKENKTGKVIAEVKFDEITDDPKSREKLKTRDHTKTEVRGRALVERMMEQIKKEQENYKQDKPTIFFSRTGGTRLARTYNCIQWARKCLSIADIELPERISENFFPTPTLYTGSSIKIAAQEIPAFVVRNAPVFGAFWGPAGVISGVAISATATILNYRGLIMALWRNNKKDWSE